MAANTTQAQGIAEATSAAKLSQLWTVVLKETKAFLDRNADLAIDWSNGDLSFEGTAIDTDANGNINTLNFTPAQCSNAIGTMDGAYKAMTNVADLTKADHLGNLNLIAAALNVRADRV